MEVFHFLNVDGRSMSQLDQETIKMLTRLSRIECSEDECSSLLEDLSKIITYVEQLDEIDTENVQPCNHVLTEVSNVMRDDETGKTLSRETFLANAPSHVGGMIKVPPVITGHKS